MLNRKAIVINTNSGHFESFKAFAYAISQTFVSQLANAQEAEKDVVLRENGSKLLTSVL